MALGRIIFVTLISKEYFVHLNRIVSLRQLFIAGKKYKSNFPGVFVMKW